MARKMPEKLAGKRPMGKDQKNEDEEDDYVEEVFNTEKGSMKSIPIPPRNLQKSDETEDGKPAGIPPLEKVPRKAVPKQKPAEEKDGELKIGAKKEKANLKTESAGNRPKSTVKDAPKPHQSFAAAGKPKSAGAKRKAVEDLNIAQSKKKKEENILAKIFGNMFEDSEEESEDNAPMTTDGLIKRAEKIFEQTPELLIKDKKPNVKQTEGIVKVVEYTTLIAELNKKSKAGGNEATPFESPIWSIEEDALKTLHGLQTLNIMLCDILGASLSSEHDAKIMKVLSIYMNYQLHQNDSEIVDFDQDLEVMEKLIEKHVSGDGSISNVFSKIFPVKNHPVLGGWEGLKKLKSAKSEGKKGSEKIEDSDSEEKNGARLLLLLAYMMVSNVLDDDSNKTQIRPAIAILGCKTEWRDVLRNLGQMFFLISPDPSISEYEECCKICGNRNHFLNAYLYVNKTAGKKGPSLPKMETSRALQRLAVLSMSAFLLNRYQQLPATFVFAELKRCRMINNFLEEILPTGKMNILTALGYDIVLRNWIFEKTGKLQLHEKKARVNKDVALLRTQLMQIDNRVRKTLKDVESRLDNMQEDLQNAKNAIEKLQNIQQWFSMNKVLLNDLLYGNLGDINFAENENHDEKDKDTDNNANAQKNSENVGEAPKTFEARGEEIKKVESEEEEEEKEESEEEAQVQYSESDVGDEEEESVNASEK